MTIFFVIATIVVVGGTSVAGYYAQTVPVLESLLLPFSIICIALGGVAAVFIIIKIIGEIHKIPARADSSTRKFCIFKKDKDINAQS